MLIFWRGRGIAVLPILFGWIFFLIIVMIATDGPEADPNAAANTSRLFALAFALSAATVFYLARRKSQSGEVPDPETGEIQLVAHHDEFMFIPMKYWSYLFAAVAIYLAGKSFFE